MSDSNGHRCYGSSCEDGCADTSRRDRDDVVGLALDCRHYLGDRPCGMGCQGRCQHYEPMGTRILIIKLGALGDVIRTAALLPGLKRVYPTSQITWVSRAAGCRMLANHPLIDRLLPLDAETTCHLQVEKFDVLINLDKEPGPAGLAMQVEAADKRGIGLSPYGTVFPLNEEAGYYFKLGLDDDLKFKINTHSYQRLMYEAVGMSYAGERYCVYPPEHSRARARELFAAAGVSPDADIIGLNTGAGRVFANKTWPEQRFIELGRRLLARANCHVALLGGPEEHDRNERIAAALGPAVVHTGCHHEELDFAAIVGACSTVLTGDTTAMHVAVALGVPVVALFGPTCHQEVDLYGRGLKLVSAIDCAPCYKRHCDLSPNCMDRLDVDRAEEAVIACLERAGGPRTIALEILDLPVTQRIPDPSLAGSASDSGA